MCPPFPHSFNYVLTEQAENLIKQVVTALEIAYRLFNKGMKNWNKTTFHPLTMPAAQFLFEMLSHPAGLQYLRSKFNPDSVEPSRLSETRNRH